MKTMNVADFKTHFSDVIKAVRAGEEIAVSYGKKHETIGVFVPYAQYSGEKKRSLGILKARASFRMDRDFKMDEDEFLRS